MKNEQNRRRFACGFVHFLPSYNYIMQPKQSSRVLLHILCATLSLSACTGSAGPESDENRSPQPQLSRTWNDEHVRLIDPIDAPRPELDINAVYTQESGNQLKIRVDFLDLPIDPATHLILVSGPVSSSTQDTFLPPLSQTISGEWDWLIDFPPGQPAQFSEIQQSPQLAVHGSQIQWFPQSDSATITLDLDQNQKAEDRQYRIFTLPPEGQNPIDDTGTFSQYTQLPPDGYANVALVFWNVLKVGTPVQVIRRWDGAHTGPLGQRHGLRHLLDSVSTTGVPVFLLDLKSGTTLNLLDEIGVVPLVQKLASDGLLILPDPACGSSLASIKCLEYNMETSLNFGFLETNWLFGPVPIDLLPPGRHAFFHSTQSGLFRYQDHNLLSIPVIPGEQRLTTSYQQVERSGLSIELKQALVELALSGSTDEILVLGGDLSSSAWADQSVSSIALQYLAGRPWIRVLDERQMETIQSKRISELPCEDLFCTSISQTIAVPAPNGSETVVDLSMQHAVIYTRLYNLPPGSLTDFSWSAFFKLSHPTNQPKLQALQAVYLSHLTDLIDAIEWTRAPRPMSTCNNTGCVLSSLTTYTHYHPTLGYLDLVVSLIDDEPILWIAPFALSHAGLSDPSEWDFTRGFQADQNEVAGGFITGKSYLSKPLESGIQFSEAAGKSSITYQLEQNTLTVEINDMDIREILIPQVFIQSGPEVHATKRDSIQIITGEDQLSVFAQDAHIDVQDPAQTRQYFGQPENPDFSYTPEFYLPLGTGLISVKFTGTSERHTILLQITKHQ